MQLSSYCICYLGFFLGYIFFWRGRGSEMAIVFSEALSYCKLMRFSRKIYKHLCKSL